MDSITQESALLKIEQAAKYLAISRRTLWTLIADKEIPSIRFRRTTRIARADLDQFIQNQRGAAV